MSTNSSISMLNDDGTVTSIYCHWDGYLSYNGRILYDHYNDKEKVKQLIALGSLSSLREHVTVNITIYFYLHQEPQVPDPLNHKFHPKSNRTRIY